MLRTLILTVALLMGAIPAQARARAGGDLEAVQPWSRPANAGTMGVGYMVLINHGRAPAVLIKVESPQARRVEMHRASLAAGVMSMAAQRQVEVPAGGRVVFEPGGYHLMFVGLTRPLKPGDRLPAMLTFAGGRRLKVAFAVGDGSPPPNGRNS